MSATPGLVNSVVPFSVVDGPGSRLVIFLQGCNFDCIACHNPYTISVCTDCGVCIAPCPEDALSFDADHHVVVDRKACTDCGICIDICPENSTPLAERRTVASLLDEVRRARPFIRGVTVSGGEATLQMDFLVDLFSAIRTDADLTDLDLRVDSNGTASPEDWDRLAPLVDGVMVDLKALDAPTHLRLTTRRNRRVLTSIRHLARIGKLAEVRILIMPGYNDSEGATTAAASWLATVAPGVPVALLGYRHAGVRSEGLHVPEPLVADLEVMAARFADARSPVSVVAAQSA